MSRQAFKAIPRGRSILSNFILLPTPSSLTYNWNYGSTLGLCLMVQIGTGLFLAMHYSAGAECSFARVVHICNDVNYGSWIRNLHANGASLFFIMAYLHIGRGLYYGRYTLVHVWGSGVLISLVLIATAFIGYVLPWGQISFWGATVITNLISAIPYFGEALVIWIWGGFAVRGATLVRFFTLHFILPFILLGLILLHLILLHTTGSSSPLGVNANIDKAPFRPYFAIKDFLRWIIIFGALLLLSLTQPWDLGDPENFIPADPLVTPVHIKPEWYFLFAYAILRSIPNKLGGVIALAASIFILWPLIFRQGKFKATSISPLRKRAYWYFVSFFFILTWIGGNPVEPPFIFIGQLVGALYFMYFGATMLWVLYKNDL